LGGSGAHIPVRIVVQIILREYRQVEGGGQQGDQRPERSTISCFHDERCFSKDAIRVNSGSKILPLRAFFG
jgi:hypothetical protein